MSSVGKKLTLNFSKGRLKKKDHLQDESDMGHRRGSWDTLHPRSGSKGDKSNSLTSLGVTNGEVLNHSDILELTQIVRSFTEALYSLKSIFNLDGKQEFNSANEIKTEAHERLGRLLCQLSGMKKYPTVLTSDVLMAVHHVITKVKLCNYEDFVSESGEVLDHIDKLALSFSTSVSEYLMGGMNLDSSIARSKSCEQLADLDHNTSALSSDRHSISTAVTEPSEDIDQMLLKFDHAVDMALNRAKLWSKYAKDITYYVEKRASMEAEFAKGLAKLAAGVQQTISEDTFLPFQSIFYTALEQDTDYTNKCQATYSLIQSTKFVGPVNERRVEHDKIRKTLKDMWTKEMKKMHEAVSAVKKARALYVSRQQEYEKAKDATQRAESESMAQSSGLAKMEKKKKLEEDCLHKAMEAETTYKSWVGHANNCQQELENVKADILSQTRDLLLTSDQVLKSATVGYFQLLQNAIAPVPSQFKQLCESSERYDSGSKYAEYVKHLPPPGTPYAPPHYSFDPYSPDSRGYELRKPSTQSSGSGSDVQLYGEDSPHSQHLRVKHGATDPDSDTGSASSSRSGSPSPSPYPQKRSHHGSSSSGATAGAGVSSERFHGMLLSPSARTHAFRKLRAPTRCRQCDRYVYFQGAECEQCGIASHKGCLETLQYECGHKQPAPARRMTTFGVDLCAHVSDGQPTVPHIVTQCTSEIDNRALDIKGIYRVSGVKSRVESLCQSFENDPQCVELSEHNPHVISNVLKLYLRQLPEPLLTFKLYPILVQLAKDESSGSISKEDMLRRLTEAVQSLPAAVACTLAHLMHHLKRVVEHEPANQMSAANLGIVFGPNLLRTSDGGSSLNSLIETPHQTRIIELLILHADGIFGSEEKPSDVVPDSSHLSPDVAMEVTTPLSATWPTTPADITGNLLAELEKDPQFMQASATASAFPATTGDDKSEPTPEADKENTNVDQGPEPSSDQQVSNITTDKHIASDSSDGAQHTTNSAILHAPPHNKDNVQIIISTPSSFITNQDVQTNASGESLCIEKEQTAGSTLPIIENEQQNQNGGAERKEDLNDNTHLNDKHESETIIDSYTGAKTANTKPAITEQGDLRQKNNDTTGGKGEKGDLTESNTGADTRNGKTTKGAPCDSKTTDVKTSISTTEFERSGVTTLQAALISPPRGIEGNVNELTRSPGLRKKLLPAHVRKTDNKPSLLSPHLSQPRPLSFRVSKNPRVLVSAPSYETQDDINLPSSSKFASMLQLKRDDPDTLSKSASSAGNNTVLKQLRSINKVKRQLPLAPGSPPYVSPYASPVVSPMVSPRVSPNVSPSDTPKNSPRSSPRFPRRNNSPLTLVSDREPQYV